jgi:selenoprotein W-related protein
MAADLLEKYGTDVKSMTLIPSGGGVYEVEHNGTLIYSKKQTGEFPDINQITSIIDKEN